MNGIRIGWVVCLFAMALPLYAGEGGDKVIHAGIGPVVLDGSQKKILRLMNNILDQKGEVRVMTQAHFLDLLTALPEEEWENFYLLEAKMKDRRARFPEECDSYRKIAINEKTWQANPCGDIIFKGLTHVHYHNTKNQRFLTLPPEMWDEIDLYFYKGKLIMLYVRLAPELASFAEEIHKRLILSESTNEKLFFDGTRFMRSSFMDFPINRSELVWFKKDLRVWLQKTYPRLNAFIDRSISGF